jgi:hypothetical protein
VGIQAGVLRRKDPEDLELGVSPLGAADHPDRLRIRLVGLLLGDDGDDDVVGGEERRDREEPEVGRAVDEDVVVVAGPVSLELAQGAIQGLRRLGLVPALEPVLDTLEGPVPRDEVEPAVGRARGRRDRDGADRRLVHHDVVEVRPVGLDPAPEAKPVRLLRLGIGVDDEDPAVVTGKAERELDHRGGLAHPSLLHGDGDGDHEASSS